MLQWVLYACTSDLKMATEKLRKFSQIASSSEYSQVGGYFKVINLCSSQTSASNGCPCLGLIIRISRCSVIFHAREKVAFFIPNTQHQTFQPLPLGIEPPHTSHPTPNVFYQYTLDQVLQAKLFTCNST